MKLKIFFKKILCRHYYKEIIVFEGEESIVTYPICVYCDGLKLKGKKFYEPWAKLLKEDPLKWS
jgi:hypothetical protein